MKTAVLKERRVTKRGTVGGTMTREVVTVSPSETIRAAAARLARHGISAAPVVDRGKLVGIVSEADLVRVAFPPATTGRGGPATMTLLGLVLRGRATGLPEHATVESVMTRHVVTVEPSASLADAVRTMDRLRLKRLPVVDDEGRVAGIISRADLVSSIARTDEELRDDVIDAIRLAGEESVADVEVDVTEGTATLSGTADRKSTKDLALRLAARVPGVLEVVDRLEFESDETKDIPRQKDPWAIGPLVKAG
ncbi:MAG TPA: CBS domain-containing protein [Actinomycetota bacterium]|nr:CBS domain-containing protein [Actinomycetota bacterium]